MPQLSLLGRRWHLASDDFPLPAALGVLWHGSWMCVCAMGLSFAVRQLPDTCFYRTGETLKAPRLSKRVES